MNISLFLLIFLILLEPAITFPQNDNYQVVGVPCALNEEVSCLIVKCPAGRYCPAEKFCYNPKCICRQGYRRAKGICVKKKKKKQVKTSTQLWLLDDI